MRGTELRSDIPEAERRKITAARCVVAAACHPGTKLEVADIAKRTSLAENTVREILASDEWKDLVHQEIERKVSAALGKFTVRCNQILDDENKASLWIDAGNAMTRLHKTLVDTGSKTDKADSFRSALSLIEVLEQARGIKRLKVEVSSASDS